MVGVAAGDVAVGSNVARVGRNFEGSCRCACNGLTFPSAGPTSSLMSRPSDTAVRTRNGFTASNIGPALSRTGGKAACKRCDTRLAAGSVVGTPLLVATPVTANDSRARVGDRGDK